jgi:hypothetical protein
VHACRHRQQALALVAWALVGHAFLATGPCMADAPFKEESTMEQSTKGKWGPILAFPLVPVAAATLVDGRVRASPLVFSSKVHDADVDAAS